MQRLPILNILLMIHQNLNPLPQLKCQIRQLNGLLIPTHILFLLHPMNQRPRQWTNSNRKPNSPILPIVIRIIEMVVALYVGMALQFHHISFFIFFGFVPPRSVAETQMKFAGCVEAEGVFGFSGGGVVYYLFGFVVEEDDRDWVRCEVVVEDVVI